MHKPSSFRDYVIALLIGASVTVLLGFYLYLRRGYLFDAPVSADSFYVPNKALAGSGVMLIAFTFLVGPIARYFDKFDAWLGYRKEIGIVGCFLAAFHALGSFFLLPLKYPPIYLLETPIALWAGVLGITLLVLLYILSFKKVITSMNGMMWWFLQRWGLRLVVLLTVIHVAVLKWQNWWTWYNHGGRQTPELLHPALPPAALLAALFIGWVIIVRLYESIFLYQSFGFGTKEIIADAVLRARGRRFFIWSFWGLVVLYIAVLSH